MKTEASNSDSNATPYFFVATVLGSYGLINNLLLFGCAFLFAGAGLLCYKRQRLAGLLTAVFGIIFSAVVFFYGIGKDMALRDNGHSKPSVVVNSAAG